MTSPRSSKGKVASGRTARRSRVRANASAGDSRTPELFPEAERSKFSPRPEPTSQDPNPREGGSGLTVSKRALKFVLGLLLLPVAAILTAAFAGILGDSIRRGILAERSFGCLVAGMVLFGILFAVIPRKILTIAYVFGHEVTHALWVKLFRGRVADGFHVGEEGGHVLTDRVNTWIVLAPYFFPIYGILAGTLYGVMLLAGRLIDPAAERHGLYETIASFQWLFLVLLGATLAFHLTFTFLLVTKSQPDLHYGGTLFSLVKIYLINLLIIGALVIAMSPKISWQDCWRHLADSSIAFVELCGRIGVWCSAWISDVATGLGA